MCANLKLPIAKQSEAELQRTDRVARISETGMFHNSQLAIHPLAEVVLDGDIADHKVIHSIFSLCQGTGRTDMD